MDKGYIEFIANLKKNIVQSRYVAMRLANKEQLMLYFRTGKMLAEKIAAEKWGDKVLERIANDLQQQLPGLRGFSFRNLKNMRQFAAEYEDFFHSMIIGQSATAQLGYTPETFFGISFTHHILIMNKCKQREERTFYIAHAIEEGWSVHVLEHHIKGELFKYRGKLINNFKSTLSKGLKTNALEVFQDEYLFDFVAQVENDERAIEGQFVQNIKKMIMTLGKGFCYIANQYRLEVGGDEFFVDLLFFNRHLQSLVAFELKRGKFKPEYAGQLNFYLNVLDERVRLPHENASIGIVLCKEKNNTVVEFAVKTIDKAMGVATYRTTKEMPKEMKGILPDTSELARLL
jgi:predicted nuclease of restriction endonuclease-like (RecB) superfamily